MYFCVYIIRTANWMGLKVVTGSLYLGRFIGDQGTETMCKEENIERWVATVRTLSEVTRNHLQADYAGLQKSLKQEWKLLQ